jgi:hypothetical protein
MKVGLVGAFFCVVVISTGDPWAADRLEAPGSMTSAAVTTAIATAAAERDSAIDPYIDPKIPDPVQEKLHAAVALAAARIEEVEECNDLFAKLGADGLEMLSTTLFFPARALNRRDGVCRRAATYTTVGGKSTFVCPEFSSLSDERAAMYVIHEALHHAGLSEKPLDRRAMTSLQINTMVSTKCRF